MYRTVAGACAAIVIDHLSAALAGFIHGMHAQIHAKTFESLNDMAIFACRYYFSCRLHTGPIIC